VISTFDLTVRYVETDAQGIVHHSNYLAWFEEGRSHLLRELGLPYSEIETAGYNIVVAEAEIKYRAPARYEDVVTIETRVERARGRLLEFRYRALHPDGRLYAEGRTLHMILDRQLKPTSLPPEILARLTAGPEETR